jgi:ethanolamine utilization protein EutJ
VAGAEDITFEAAEELKVNPAEQKRLFPIIRPVMEKVGDIVSRHVRISQVEVKQLTLVGGTCNFPGMAEVVAEYTGLPTFVPQRPEFVTPVGIAMNDTGEQDWEG